MSPSTLTKDCPRCHAALALDVSQCHCGHKLDGDTGPDLVTQAEVLYETHLRARLQRTTRLARIAKVDLLRDPTNMAKKAQLNEMEKELLMLEKQLDLQSARIADARTAAQRSMDVTAIEAFRAAQSAKAEQSIELNRLQAALDESRASSASIAFSTAQAGRAANVVQERIGTQTCPNCNAAIGAGAARCACGHALRGNEDKEFLSADERSALRDNT
ncbi:MAG TPA: hypothetical protein VJS66_08630 [Burkholderiales bacterium]|nr:hypothetical protein [Burkholderiales bacterium]